MPSPETPHEPGGGELVPVKFSRLTRRGILLGLSLSQLITLGVGGASLVAAFYGGGGLLFLIGAVVGCYNIWMTIKTAASSVEPETTADRPAIAAVPALQAGE